MHNTTKSDIKNHAGATSPSAHVPCFTYIVYVNKIVCEIISTTLQPHYREQGCNNNRSQCHQTVLVS